MLDVLIVGAGPAGLACAIAARSHGLTYGLVEKGSVADAIRRFPTGMTFFSTSEMLEIGGVPFISGGFRPTRVEVVRYFAHVVRSCGLHVDSYQEITSIEKQQDHFLVRSSSGSAWQSKKVVVATGYFDSPNPFDVPGPAASRIRRYYDEPYAYIGRKVALVGGRNAVVDAALEMYREGVNVTIIHRGPFLSQGVKYWMLPEIETKLRTGQIRGLFNTIVSEVRDASLMLAGDHAGEIENDVLFVLIGYSIDTTLLSGAGVTFDQDTLAPDHDAETYETNVPGLFVAGSLAAGNMNNRIFIENGRGHGEVIMKTIAERLKRLEK